MSANALRLTFSTNRLLLPAALADAGGEGETEAEVSSLYPTLESKSDMAAAFEKMHRFVALAQQHAQQASHTALDMLIFPVPPAPGAQKKESEMRRERELRAALLA